MAIAHLLRVSGVPKGIRTPVTAVKGRCPRPLDDGDTVCVTRTLNDSFTIKGPNVGINTIDPQHKLDVNGTFRATGATTLSSTLSVASNLKVDGHILLQGGKKFHIGRSGNDTPNASDNATVLISGATNSGPPGTLGTLFKIDNYNNDSNSSGIPNQKVIIYENENGHEDYYFKSSRDANTCSTRCNSQRT